MQVVGRTRSVHLELPVHLASRRSSPARAHLSLLPPSPLGWGASGPGFWFWLGLIFHILAPWPTALTEVSAVWMVLNRIQG